MSAFRAVLGVLAVVATASCASGGMVETRYDGRTVLVEPDDYGQQRRRISRSVSRGGCEMPDIIIDDYYPGGPLVGCDGSYGPRPRW